MMQLSKALRVTAATRMAIVGSGGKTTSLFRLARDLSGPVLLTTTTHLGNNQIALADRQIVLDAPAQLQALEGKLDQQVIVFTGPPGELEDRTAGPSPNMLDALHQFADQMHVPLLIEADGARSLPMKAPAPHEPAIPAWVNTVVVVVGLSGLAKPLNAAHIHRPEVYSRLTGLPLHAAITPDAVEQYLKHAEGGLKHIPPGARRVVLLNQADTPELQSLAGNLAARLLDSYDAVLVASLGNQAGVYAVYERIGGIILAAGAAERYGAPKALLPWRGKPLVRHVAETALQAGLSPVIVVVGAEQSEMASALAGLPVKLVNNQDWQSGQSSSIKIGLQSLPVETGAVFFLLADQPQVPFALLSHLIGQYRLGLPPILAPEVEGRRATPVLFDRVTFPDLSRLQGDVGGRAIFSRYKLTYYPWNDANLLLDVDTPADYQRLLEMDQE